MNAIAESDAGKRNTVNDQGRQQRMWIGLVAAYLLAVQSLFGAYAAGAMAAPDRADFSGFVICSSHGILQQQDGELPDRKQILDYCRWACSVVPVALPPPAGAADIVVVDAAESKALLASGMTVPSRDRKGIPGNPRAPPHA